MKTYRHRRGIFLIAVVVISLFILSACHTVKPYAEDGFYFDTYVKFCLYGDDRVYLDDCFDICEENDSLLSAHDEDSLLYKLNHGDECDFSALVPVLSDAFYYHELTGGAVAPCIGAVSMLWDFNDPENAQFPGEADVSEALKHINSSSVVISDGDITITDPDCMIDLGFIAKGYISGIIRDYLKQNGVKSGIINLGGNVVVIGKRPDGRDYNVGIQRPFGNDAILTFFISDSAVVTSGIYERYFERDSKIYHHILDPDTGYPVDNDLYSVSIVSPDPVMADALSTACLVMGREKALEFIEDIDNAEALLIDKDMNIYTSSGFPEYSLND